jgi:hypothetical protein
MFLLALVQLSLGQQKKKTWIYILTIQIHLPWDYHVVKLIPECMCTCQSKTWSLVMFPLQITFYSCGIKKSRRFMFPLQIAFYSCGIKKSRRLLIRIICKGQNWALSKILGLIRLDFQAKSPAIMLKNLNAHACICYQS